MNTLPDNELPTLAYRRRVAGQIRPVSESVGERTLWTIQARPISAGQLTAYFSAIDAGTSIGDAALTLLRACFATVPRAWWARDHAAIVNADENYRRGVLDALMVTPGVLPDAPDERRYGVLGRWQSAITAASGTPMTIHDAITATITAYGVAWYHDASTWRTADGTPPAGVVYAEAFALRAAGRMPVVLPPLPFDPHRGSPHLN